MEQTKETQIEEITDFPMQDTFNTDCMEIGEEGDEDGVCHADK